MNRRKKKKKHNFNVFNIIKFLGEDTNYKPKTITEKDNNDALTETTYESLKFASWVQTFTKRIIVVTFGIFIIIDLITLIISIINCFQLADTTAVNNLITETNTTFRDIIGGYLVKSACENVSIGIEKALVRYINQKYNISADQQIEDDLQEQSEPLDAGVSITDDSGIDDTTT